MKVINYYPLDKRTDMVNEYEIWTQDDNGINSFRSRDIEQVKKIEWTDWHIVIIDIETLTPGGPFISPEDAEFNECEVKLICVKIIAPNEEIQTKVYLSKDLNLDYTGAKLVRRSNPSAAFLKWLTSYSNQHPTILTGFGIGTSFKRSKLPGYDLPAIFQKANYQTFARTTAFMYGTRANAYAIICFDKVIVLDLMLYLSKINEYDSRYKIHLMTHGGLNGVSSFYSVGAKDNCTPEMINEGLRETCEMTGTIVDYCIKDVELCRLILDKVGGLSYLQGFLSSAQISIPLTLGGVTRRTAILLRFLISEGPEQWKFGNHLAACHTTFDRRDYKGGSVRTESGIFKLRALLDYNSLYPSVCIQYNICATTFLGFLESNNELANSDPYLVKLSPTQTACFTKQFKGLLPTLMSKCLKERQVYKDRLKDGTNYAFNKSCELAWKLIGNGSYGAMGAETFDFYTVIVPASITAAGRAMFATLQEITEGLGFRSVYGDTDSQFLTAPDNIAMSESELVRTINATLQARDLTNLKIAGELGDIPEHILLTGKKKCYAVHKEGKLKTSGFKYSQYSADFTTIFYATVKSVLKEGIFEGKHIETFFQSCQAANDLYKLVKRAGVITTVPLTPEDALHEFLHHYLGYELNKSDCRYYTTEMSWDEIAQQITRPCSAWLKNLDSHTEDPRAELVMQDFVNPTVKFMFFNAGQIQLLPYKQSVEAYYSNLTQLNFTKCVTASVLCEKQPNGRYLIGIDIDSDNPDRIEWWPVDTYGCRSRRGLHLIYLVDRPPLKRQFGSNTSVYGQVEVKTGKSSLSVRGYHRSMAFQYEPIDLPIAWISAEDLSQRLLTAVEEPLPEELTISPLAAPSVSLPVEAPVSETMSLTRVPRQLIEFAETVDEEEPDVTFDYVLEADADDVVLDELKERLANTKPEQWQDYSGYCVPVFLALGSLLTPEELAEIIGYCKRLPAFQHCKRLTKLDKFKASPNGILKARCSLKKHGLFTYHLIKRYNNTVTRPARVISNCEVKERMTVADLEVEEDVIAIKAPYGHGKTVTVCEHVKELDERYNVVIFLTNRLTQIDSIKKRLGSHQYEEIRGGKGFTPGHSVYIIQYESLYKCHALAEINDKYVHVIVDEAQSFMSQIVTSPNKAHYCENVAICRMLLASCYKLIIMDGELSDLVVNYYAGRRSCKRYQYTWTQTKYETQIVDGGRNLLRAEQRDPTKNADTQMLQLDLEIKAVLEAGERIGICSDEKAMTIKYFNALRNDYRVLLVNSDSPLAPDTNFAEYDVICWSPSIIHTVSIEAEGFTTTFGIFQHHYLEDYKLVNQMHRIRTVRRLLLFIRNLNSSPGEAGCYEERKDYHRKVLTNYTPFAIKFYGTGSNCGNSEVIDYASSAKAIRDVQLKVNRSFERYSLLFRPTSSSVQLLELNRPTELRWSFQLYEYPERAVVRKKAINETEESFGADVRLILVDQQLRRFDMFLRAYTNLTLNTDSSIVLEGDVYSELKKVFKDFRFLRASGIYHYTELDGKLTIEKVDQTAIAHEPEIPTVIVEPEIPTQPCTSRQGAEFHVLRHGTRNPGAGWLIKKVKMRCEHTDKECYVREWNHPCGNSEHDSAVDRPDGDGWTRGQVKRAGCEHTGQRCWIRPRTNWSY